MENHYFLSTGYVEYLPYAKYVLVTEVTELSETTVPALGNSYYVEGDILRENNFN